MGCTGLKCSLSLVYSYWLRSFHYRFFGRGLVTLDYEAWKPKRRLYEPAFNRRLVYVHKWQYISTLASLYEETWLVWWMNAHTPQSLATWRVWCRPSMNVWTSSWRDSNLMLMGRHRCPWRMRLTTWLWMLLAKYVAIYTNCMVVLCSSTWQWIPICTHFWVQVAFGSDFFKLWSHKSVGLKYSKVNGDLLHFLMTHSVKGVQQCVRLFLKVWIHVVMRKWAIGG